MTTISDFPFGVKPHFTFNCPFAVIGEIRIPSPPEVVIDFIARLRKIPVTFPSISDIFSFRLTKRLALEQHGVELQFHHERMLSRAKDREGYYRLLIADALCECGERVRLARQDQDADDVIPMVPTCGGCSRA